MIDMVQDTTSSMHVTRSACDSSTSTSFNTGPKVTKSSILKIQSKATDKSVQGGRIKNQSRIEEVLQWERIK